MLIEIGMLKIKAYGSLKEKNELRMQDISDNHDADWEFKNKESWQGTKIDVKRLKTEVEEGKAKDHRRRPEDTG